MLPPDAEPSEDLTGLLKRWRAGDAAALDSFAPLVYAELRRVARRQLGRERDGHTLASAAVVNEAFLRLIRHPDVDWQDRAHFFAVAAQMIRRILVDHARRKVAAKRDGGPPVELDDNAARVQPQPVELIALDTALKRLAELDPQQAKIVELRYFGGMSNEETAEALGISVRTVARHWSTARLFLLREINGKK